MGIESIPVNIPDKWSAAWFRVFIAEVLAKLDARNAVGVGVAITSDGNSVATIDAQTDIDEAIATHDAEATAHSAAIAAHVALADPHSQYATDTDLSDHVSDTDPHPDLIADLDASNVSLDDEIMVLVGGTHRRATLGQLGAIVNGQSWKVPAKGAGTFTGHAPTI